MYKVFSVFLRVTKGSHNGKQGIVRQIVVVCLFLTLLFNAGVSWGQLFQQDFSGSTTVSNYASALAPTNAQFNAIASSGAGVVTSIHTTTSNKLRFAQSTSNAGSFSRNTDFASTPTTLMYKFDLAVGGSSTPVTTLGVFQIGSGFGTANSAETNANTYARFGFNTTSTPGTFSIRDVTNGTSSSNLIGTQAITWVLNNSGASVSYRTPNNTQDTVANDKADLWAGTIRILNDVSVQTASQTMTDMKFVLTGGTNVNVDMDNFLIDSIPGMPTSSSASSIVANGFRANWASVSGVTGYRLDVATDSNFTSMLAGYNDVYVTGQSTVFKDITGLSANTTYWYRVRGASQYTIGEFAGANSVSQNPTTLSSCSTPSITLVSKTNVTCHGGSNGAIDLTVSAGTAIWSDASTTVDRAGLSAGTYSVTITDGACSSTASYTITQPTAIVPAASSNGPLCAGSTLVLSSSATGGSGTYSTYVWSGPNSYTSSNQQNTILSATTAATGIYTITVTDNAGCTKTSSTTVSVNALPTVSVSPSASSMCVGAGAITLTASNATSYSWLPMSGLNTSSAATVNASPASTTTYTVTASNGVCSNTATAIITVNQHTTIGSVTTTACNSYLWAANGLTYTASGVYTVASTNAQACINTATLNLTINQSNNSSTSLTAIGQYVWHGTTYTASGTYYNYTTGLTNCADTATLILTVTPACSITLNAVVDQSISCYGFNNGSIQAQAAPSGLYTYTIDGGTATNTTGFFANITPGLHTVCATDGVCSLCQTVVMTEPDLLTVNFLTDSTVSCIGNDGALTAIVTGGSATIQPYLTTWSNGVNANSLYALSATGLSAVTYTITVEDDRQCFATATATLGLTPAVSVSATSSTITCFGGTSTISTTASGGTGTMSTTISGGSFTVTAGTYTITATDTKGCTGTTVITINQPSQLANSSNITVCTSYVFNGITYTNSGVYTHTLTSANGCDSLHTLNLTVHYNTSMGNSTITACDSYTWNGATYTTSGLYTFTSLNAFSCVNTATLDLTINNSSTSSAAATACDSYTWNCTNSNYTQSGAYTCTSLNAAGCVHTATLNLTINSSTTSSSSATACDSYTWTCTNATYSQSGDYTCTSLNAAGCLHTTTLHLTINNSSTSSLSATACDSYTWNCTNSTYTQSGDYTCTSLNVVGCANTATLHLTINNTSASSSSATACDSYTWNCTNSNYTQSGAYTCTSLNAAGCVHTATLNLTINSSTTSSSSATACDSYTWTCTNATYSQSGDYTCTSLNAAGCLHTTTLHLTINNSSTSSLSVTACDSYTWNCTNSTYTQSGDYTCTSLNAVGCVNTATLHLIINNTSASSSSATACDSYTWNCTNSTYTQSGAYTCTSLNAAGCVHTATLNLTINSSTTSSSSATACDSYTWTCTNASYSNSGAYACTSLNAAGCLHTTTLHLTINNSSTSSLSETACDSYTWNCTNVTYTNSGTYTCTSFNAFTCVNTATLHLTINNSSTSSSSVTACDSYTWNCNNEIYTQAAAYVCTSLNAAGCVNTATLNLAINSSSTSSVSAQASNSYTWPCNNMTYVLSGAYTCTSLNSYGCVNTATLTLTIFNTTSNTTTASACDSYTWPYTNQSYSNSGTYTATSLNTLGNLHVEILNVIINHSSASSSSATACDSYTWNCTNVTYTQSGIYTCTFLNASGCVHTSTLHLTINNSSLSSSSATSCDSYTWNCNNATYTNSGIYTCTFLNATGCVHTSTLNLTVNYSSVSSSSATACDSYTWNCNNATYSNSGIYTCTFLNASGCVHTSTLHLTINNSSSSSSSATACDSYTWNCNNATYTNSGSYTCTFLNASGCVHTSTLNLTVNYSSVSSSSATACDSYTWNCNNATYANSGIYTCTFLNASGCVHTSTLNLTVNYSSVSSSSATACDSYTWTCNNATYSNSGVYTCTFLNASGCVHTATLNLTVNYSSVSSSSATACDSYTWTCNNGSYSNSGVYTCTFLNASGCVHTSTLNLTVNYSSVSSSSATACDSYTWNCNNATYTNSGIYTCTFLNASGCVHTSTLHSTVNYSSTSSSTATSCDSYNWNCNNATYTNSGIYTCTFLNASGCLHTSTLNLTVRYSSTSSSSATACDSYTWNCNNGTYTISGAYTCTTLNASGCVNTATLNVTIRYSNTGNSPMTQCYNYTWNGTTYTLSGNYPHTYQNISGCDSVHTLNLIIHYSNSGSSNLSMCDTYTWNGITYTTSGAYLHTYSNVYGCDSVHTLHLTIRRSNAGSSALTKCDSYVWNNGVTYTTSGIYLHTYTNVVGCDSLHTLNLTVHYSNTGASSAVTCDTLTWRGTVYTLTGVYTKTFTNVVGCDSVHYLNLTVNYSTHNVIKKDTCETYTWATGTGVTYTVSGTYLYYYINQFNCASTDTLKLDVRVKVSVKVFLAGPYDETTGLMSDSLRISRLTSSTPPTSIRLIPRLNPYGNSVPPYGNSVYPAIGYAGGDTVSQAILAVTGANAIVDWVLLELRKSSNQNTVVANKRALIQRDGDVVSATDGVSPVAFSDTLKPGNYYVSIKHRNHMGIMSANAPRLNGCSTVFDFTSASGAAVWTNSSITSNAPRKQFGSVYALWSGDANSNKNIKYNGTVAPDKKSIETAVGSSTLNNSLENVYRMEDVNLDGKVRYNNADNDRNVILNTIGVNTPNKVLSQHTPN